jgi:P pilus assembly chaperone PapD
MEFNFMRKKPLVLLFVILCSLLVPVSLVFAELSISISPARMEHRVNRGDQLTDIIQVTNDGGVPTRLKISLADWSISRDGNPAFFKAAGMAYSCAGWFRINPVDFRIDPGQTRDIRYTIDVPPGSADGGYRTAIIFETVPEVTPGQKAKQVQVRGQIAAVFYETVGEPVIAGSISGFRGEWKNNKSSFVLTMSNTGKVHFRSKGTIVIKDEKGNPLLSVAVPDEPVLPESERDIRINCDQVIPAGAFTAEALIDIGKKELLGAITSIELK